MLPLPCSVKTGARQPGHIWIGFSSCANAGDVGNQNAASSNPRCVPRLTSCLIFALLFCDRAKQLESTYGPEGTSGKKKRPPDPTMDQKDVVVP